MVPNQNKSLKVQTPRHQLLWYKNKKAPKYTAVVCALPTKNSKEEELFSLVDKKITKFVV